MSKFNGYSEHYTIGRAMEVYGGSFMSNLGKALQNADSENQRKIKEVWSEDWNRYREMPVRMFND